MNTKDCGKPIDRVFNFSRVFGWRIITDEK
jgi:hypothetical protein